MAEEKERLDVLVVKKGIFSSREKAKPSIMAGEIFVDGKRADKCGQKFKVSSDIEFKGKKLPYVSRGGLKLEKAVNTFNIDLKDKVCLDIGASTGGFTDCMLQNGASKVYAVDVGYGQFAWKLRIDKRVKCLERTNVRYIKFEDIGEYADFASIDVSFISLKKVLPAVVPILKDTGRIVVLIKPQFEAGREKVGKKGVVKDPLVHEEVIRDIIKFAVDSELQILGLDFSPIKGPEGNIEYLLYLSKEECSYNFHDSAVEDIVKKSHKELFPK